MTTTVHSEGMLDATGLEGTWRSRGYGWILAFDGDDVRWLDASRAAVVESRNCQLGAFLDEHDRLVLDGDILSFYETCGITRYDFDRAASVRSPIARPDPGADPVDVFESFWHTFAEQYAFFGLRGTDWSAVYQDLRRRVSGATTPTELADVLREAIRPLADCHVSIDAGEVELSSATGCRGTSLERWWQRENAAPDTKGFRAAMERWIMDDLGLREAHIGGNGRLISGRLGGDIAYLAPIRMRRYAPGDPPSVADDVAAAAAATTDALDRLDGATGLVIDARFNTGGHDAVSLAMAGHFADRPRVAFTKCARDDDGRTDPQPILVEPSDGDRSTAPIALLTSPTTGSAAESFTIALRVLPHVTIVGEPTHGILSDTLEKRLPNGWTAWLSNEIYESPDGDCFEGSGIPPDVSVEARPGESLDAYLRRGVQQALDILEGASGARPQPVNAAPGA
jgi:carboxyl-terminal processing protease